jgi:hypothetical protein
MITVLSFDILAFTLRHNIDTMISTKQRDKAMTNLKKSKTDFKALAKALEEADLSMPETASPDELRLYQLVALVSKTMLKSSYENLPQAFELSLKIVGTYLDVDRVYIFNLTKDLTRMSNTTEWCHKGVEPAIEMLQDLDVEIFPWWMKMLKSGQNHPSRGCF